MADDAELYRLSESLGYQLSSTARTHERRIETGLARIGLHRVEFTVLVTVGREGRARPSEIAEYLNVEKSTVSRAVRVLEDAGLLIVGQASSDRRVRVLCLTPRGHERMRQGIAVVVAANALIRSALSEAERAQMAAMLGRIRTVRATRQKCL